MKQSFKLIVIFLYLGSFCITLAQNERYDISKNYLPGYAGHYHDGDLIVVFMKEYRGKNTKGQSLNPTENQIREIIEDKFPPSISRYPELSTQAKRYKIIPVAYSYKELYDWEQQILNEFKSQNIRISVGVVVLKNNLLVVFWSVTPKEFKILSVKLKAFMKKNNIPNKAITIDFGVSSFSYRY